MAAAAAGGIALLASPAMLLGAGLPQNGPAAVRGVRAPAIVLAQADENVTQAQLDKYIAVYKAMQRNHGLTVEQAAAAQGLTLDQFRDVERRIERNDVARNAVRHALAKSAAQSTPSSPGLKGKSQH